MPLLLSLSLAAVLVVQGGSAGTNPSDVRSLSLDELIQRLPAIGSECWWDDSKDDRACDPATLEMERRLIAGMQPTDAQWRDALIKTGAVRIRSKWPESLPFAVSMQMPVWLPACEIRLEPRSSRLMPAKAGLLYHSSCGTFLTWVRQDALYQELGTLPLGEQELEFAVTVEAGDGTSFLGRTTALPQGVIWSGSLTLPVDVVKTLDEAIPPIRGEEVDAAVEQSLGIAFSNWGSDSTRTAILVLDPDSSTNPSLAGVALSLRVEIVRGNETVEVADLFASDYDSLALSMSRSKGARKQIAFRAIRGVPAELEDQETNRNGWVLRVSGTNQDVHTAWGSTHHWVGHIEIPIDEAIRGELRRAGPRGREPWVWFPSRR